MKHLFLISCLLMLAVFISSGQNPRNVLVYNLTDTDCGPCSCMDSIIRGSLHPAYPEAIVVALHSPMFNSGFREYQGNEVFSFFHAQYEPSGYIDGLGYDVPYLLLTDSVGHRFAHSPEAPVKMTLNSKSWDPVTRNVTMSMTMTNLGTEIPKACWVNIFVTEDHLIHIHRVYTNCATPNSGGLPLKSDFINDHVTRKLEYFAKGDSLIGPTWPSQQSVNREFTVHIDTAWQEANCNLVVAVYQYNDSLYKAPVMQAMKQSVTGGVGQEELETSETGILRIFPNPSDGWVNIHFAVAETGNADLRLLDFNGRLVETFINQKVGPGQYNAEYNAQHLPAGHYFVVLQTANKLSTKELIIK